MSDVAHPCLTARVRIVRVDGSGRLMGRCGVRVHLPGTAAGEQVVLGAAMGDDPDDVAVRARAELIERYVGLLHGTRGQSTPPHPERVDPDDFRVAGVTSAGSPVVHEWQVGSTASTEAPVSVPVAARTPEGEPHPDFLLPRVATGFAAHRSVPRAAEHGLLEVVERDTMMLSWISDEVFVRRAEVREVFERVCTSEEAGTQVRGFELARAGVATLTALVVLTWPCDGGLAAVCGSAAAVEPARALARACDEASMLRWNARRLTGLRTATHSSGFEPDSIRHFRWALGNGHHVLDRYETLSRRCFVREAVLPELRERRDGPAGYAGLGTEPVTIDLTPRWAADAGWAVTRTVAPPALSGACSRGLNAAQARRLATDHPTAEPRRATTHPFA